MAYRLMAFSRIAISLLYNFQSLQLVVWLNQPTADRILIQ